MMSFSSAPYCRVEGILPTTKYPALFLQLMGDKARRSVIAMKRLKLFIQLLGSFLQNKILHTCRWLSIFPCNEWRYSCQQPQVQSILGGLLTLSLFFLFPHDTVGAPFFRRSWLLLLQLLRK